MKYNSEADFLLTWGWLFLIILVVSLFLIWYGFIQQNYDIMPKVQPIMIINSTQELCNFTVEKIYGHTNNIICNIK